MRGGGTSAQGHVPLQFSCQGVGLRVNVTERVLQGRATEWSATVDSAWPLLVYITDCCNSGTHRCYGHTQHTLIETFSHCYRRQVSKRARIAYRGSSQGRQRESHARRAGRQPRQSAWKATQVAHPSAPPRQLGGGTPQREAPALEAPETPVFSPLPYTPLGSAGVERMLRRSQEDAEAGDENSTPHISPLPYTPMSSAEVQRMLKRARKQPRTARQLFP